MAVNGQFLKSRFTRILMGLFALNLAESGLKDDTNRIADFVS